MLKAKLLKKWDGFTLRAEFELPTPGVVALFGRSGCGKSTLVNLVSGLIEPDEGFVQLDNTVLIDTQAGVSVPVERRRIGYVFQDPRLFPHFTVMGNLRYGQKRAGKLPQVIGFDEVVTLLGIEHVLERRPHMLSGGERQRVALGRALLSQPQLLLLDEPLAGLDVARREEVLPYLEVLRDRLSIPMIYVSHQFDEVLHLATHVVLMEAGSVVAQGSLNEVSLRPELRAIVGTDAVGAVVEGVVIGADARQGLADVQLGDGAGGGDDGTAGHGARGSEAGTAGPGARGSHAGTAGPGARGGGTVGSRAPGHAVPGDGRSGVLRVSMQDARVGASVRVQILAKDVILATEPPHGLSVRNVLEGTVREVTSAGRGDAVLVRVNVGGAGFLSSVTQTAVDELGLRDGQRIWILVKATATRGRAVQLG